MANGIGLPLFSQVLSLETQLTQQYFGAQLATSTFVSKYAVYSFRIFFVIDLRFAFTM